jgi:hypothetical protein
MMASLGLQIQITKRRQQMFIDQMHSDAIKTADKTMLPQTVYRIGNDWDHRDALWAKDQLRFKEKNAVLVVTWLPAKFFS